MSLHFHPENPFPLILEHPPTYAEAQAHSAQVDAWLGLRTEEIEAQLRAETKTSQDQQLWIGLPVQAMLTPYTEIRELLHRLQPKPGQTIIDLGAGYGRMGFVLGRHFPGVRFVGYELVQARVEEGLRCLSLWHHPLIELRREDLSAADFRPLPADFYFLYDFGSRIAIEKTLQDLRAIATTRPITVIGRGRASRDAIERNHPWLSQIRAPEHFAHVSIYRS